MSRYSIHPSLQFTRDAREPRGLSTAVVDEFTCIFLGTNLVELKTRKRNRCVTLNIEFSPPGEGSSLRPLRIPRGSRWVVRAKATRSHWPRTGRGGPCGVREGLFGRPGSLPACVTRAGLAAVWAVCGLVAVGDIGLVYGPTHHSRPTGPRGASSFAVKGLCHRSESQTM